MPPACAMAIAMRASVTVSIAEEMIGMLSAMSRVMRVRISTSAGSTSDRPGFSSTSSKVSASSGPPFFLGIANFSSPPGKMSAPGVTAGAASLSPNAELARADSMPRPEMNSLREPVSGPFSSDSNLARAEATESEEFRPLIGAR